MKLNEIQLNEEMSYGQSVAKTQGKGALGQLGSAIKSAFKPSSMLGGFKMGPGSMDDATVDTMARQNFINKTAGQIAADLESAIQSGLVNTDPNASSQPAAQPAAQAPAPNPAQVASQTRQQKQAVAATTAQKQMAANPAPQQAPSQSPAAPLTPAQIRQQKQAAATTVARNQMGQLKEADQQYAFTISSRVQHFLNRFLGAAAKNPQTQAQIKSLADNVQATYGKDKGKAAMTKLAHLVFSSMQDKGPAGQSAEVPQATGDSAATASAQPTTATAAPTDSAGVAQASPPEQVKSVYTQVKDLVKSLNKQQKGWVLSALEKQLGTVPSAPTSAPTAAGSGAFGQMASNLASRPTTSSTGGTTTGVSGVGNGVVRHTAAPATKKNQLKAIKAKAPASAPVTSKPKAKASPFPVAESKIYKVWGQQ